MCICPYCPLYLPLFLEYTWHWLLIPSSNTTLDFLSFLKSFLMLRSQLAAPSSGVSPPRVPHLENSDAYLSLFYLYPQHFTLSLKQKEGFYICVSHNWVKFERKSYSVGLLFLVYIWYWLRKHNYQEWERENLLHKIIKLVFSWEVGQVYSKLSVAWLNFIALLFSGCLN